MARVARSGRRADCLASRRGRALEADLLAVGDDARNRVAPVGGGPDNDLKSAFLAGESKEEDAEEERRDGAKQLNRLAYR